MRRGTSDSEAERLLVRWLEAEGWLVHRAMRSVKRWPAPGPRCAACGRGREKVLTVSHDIFGAIDVLAILRVDEPTRRQTWALQVTTQAGRAARRRKLEAVGWPASWRVSLVSHEATPDPANRSRRRHHWAVEDLIDGAWRERVAVEFRPADLRAAAT